MLYVHVPFCRSFCRYCGFYSETVCKGQDGQAFEDFGKSLFGEIASREDEIKACNPVNTLYIGGGTPSVMPLPFFERLAARLQNGPFDEFTVEVNPDDIVRRGISFALGLRQSGVNRISMGVQSLDDGVLKWMGRRHDGRAAVKAFDILRKAGFGNISLDLIFGLGEGMKVRESLEGLIALGAEHISAYQLGLDEGSALYDEWSQGKFVECDEEVCEGEYRFISERLAAAGYDHYEISNWSKPGRRAVHNSAYWNRTPYVGLGPSAHSFSIGPDSRQTRSWNSPSLSGWTYQSETLSDEEIREEEIMLGLRTSDGVSEDILRDNDRASEAIREGLLVRSASRIRIPEDKFFVSDSIIRDII